MLSGNMRDNIRQGGIGEVVIEAPKYDIALWTKTGVIDHSIKKSKNPFYPGNCGVDHYAYFVNKNGGFNTHNSSEGWVDRTVLSAVITFANEIGAEVIYDL
jgi:hypothetical protein